MRRLLAPALALSIASACGGQGTPSNAEQPPTSPARATTTTRPRATTTIAPSEEDAFVEAIDNDGLRTSPDPLDSSQSKTYTDDELIDNGRAVCRTLDKGGLPPDPETGFPGRTPAEYLLVNEEVAEGTPNGRRIILAIRFLCPQHQAALDAALAGTHTTSPALTEFPDGNYEVGVDIAPGTYEALDVHDCYWERVDGSGRTIDNDFVSGAPRVEVVIRASDAGFNSDGCDRWRLVR